tara:strand:+ start:438 stop:1343 length:906 start_codon:yes stop_codon:yes gene_type:complete
MKILITGSSGQLGKAIIAKNPKYPELLLPKKHELDLSNPISCQKYVEDHKPDFIINCGAFTNVDLAENKEDLCFAINTNAPLEFAKVLKKYGGNLLQISTDYVFDGCKNFPYKVSDIKNPISKYGFSKARCEDHLEQILKPSKQCVILRTSWLMGPEGKNFLLTMLELHKNKKAFSVVSDQIGCMSSTKDLANICWEIIKKWKLVSNSQSWINHWTCKGSSSWYDIALEIGVLATNIGLLNNSAEIIPIKTESYPSIARRPLYSVLDCSMTEELIGIKRKDWHEELNEILIDLVNQKEITP